ncbi:MAG TPA: hypothetical protein VGG33_11600 [Polyangia bacterium]
MFQRKSAAAMSSLALAALASNGCREDGLIQFGRNGGADGGAATTVPTTPGATPMSGAAPGATSAPSPVIGAMAAGMPATGIDTAEMPAEVRTILQSRCAGCHTYGQADPSGWGSILDVSRMIDADIIVPGKPNESRLIDRISVTGDMPPTGDRVPSADVQTLRTWITNMARKPAVFMSDVDVLDAISADQLSLRDRSSDYRYVSFAHFLSEGRSDKEMETVRQVFAFIINSLSRRGQIVDVQTIDSTKSIFRLRLSDFGWNEALWDQLTSFYPYCLRSDASAHLALYQQLRTEAPVVRGDWFLATATKAPLYDLLTDLPRNLDDLGARLGVNINDDINHPGQVEPTNLTRIGFRRSGVALHNRLLERHLGNAGQYLWVSYDFDSNEGRADLMANPLGPRLRDRQNFVHTFEHAGGEVIFTMPNGLQGYMVVDAVGNRIAEVPLNVARDPRRRDGVVENALSCYGCHGAVGLLKPRELDEVPRYADTHIANFEGRELNEIEASYPRELRPDVFAADNARYRAAAETVPGGAPPGNGEYSAFVAAVGQYESNVGFRGAAAEFSEDYARFRERFLANDFQNVVLPRSLSQPLVLRDDFVCVFRDIVTKIRPNAEFCAKTFDAAAVRNSCADGRSTGSSGSGNNPGTGGRAGSGGSAGTATGAGGQINLGRGTGGAGGAPAAGGQGGVMAAGGAGGRASNTGGATGAGGSGGAAGQNCTVVNGRRICR